MSVSDQLARFTPSEQTFAGYLFWLSRPRFWLYLAGPVVVSVVYAASSPADLFRPVAVALFLYFLLPGNIFLYGVNDLFDADIDQHNPKKSEEGREVRYSGDRAVTAAIAVSALAGLPFVFVLDVWGIVGLAGFYALGAGYSAPPLRFKTTPFFDSISNGLYLMPAVVAYSALTGSFPPTLALAGGWLWTMAMHTFSAVPDIEPDREAGITTTATLLGERATLAYCAGVWLLSAVCMGLVHPLLGVLFAGYVVFVTGIGVADIDRSRAYWWFPIVNTIAGMFLTFGGLWRLLYA